MGLVNLKELVWFGRGVPPTIPMSGVLLLVFGLFFGLAPDVLS
jgi:hypothetical protein